MKKIIIGFLSLVLLASCGNNLSEEIERCNSYKQDIQDDIRYKNGLDPTNTHLFYSRVLKEMFFSPKFNSCIYIEDFALLDGPVSVKIEYVVHDFYKNEVLNTFTIKEQRNYTGTLKDFELYIKSIK